MTIRRLPKGKVVSGTTWKPSHDEFGTSFTCDVCGSHQFYKDEIPPPCDHGADKKPTNVEVAYGLLWEIDTTDPRVHEARTILLSTLDKDGQARGIKAAKEINLSA